MNRQQKVIKTKRDLLNIISGDVRRVDVNMVDKTIYDYKSKSIDLEKMDQVELAGKAGLIYSMNAFEEVTIGLFEGLDYMESINDSISHHSLNGRLLDFGYTVEYNAKTKGDAISLLIGLTVFKAMDANINKIIGDLA
jgi:hypothetical protein